MLITAATLVISFAAVYLIALGVIAFAAPSRASCFLLGFASTRRLHVAELAARLLLGGAFLILAPHSPWRLAFTVGGWVLVVTTIALAVLPWRWHRRFAEGTVPTAIRFLKPIGASSLAGGCLPGLGIVEPVIWKARPGWVKGRFVPASRWWRGQSGTPCRTP